MHLRGAKINPANKGGVTPLLSAVFFGQAPVVKVLITWYILSPMPRFARPVLDLYVCTQSCQHPAIFIQCYFLRPVNYFNDRYCHSKLKLFEGTLFSPGNRQCCQAVNLHYRLHNAQQIYVLQGSRCEGGRQPACAHSTALGSTK